MQALFNSIAILSFAISALYAATPTTINYQGYLQDSSGNDINGTKSIVFSLYTVASGGTNIWTSTKDVNVTNGVYSTVLGDTVALSGLAFDTQYYLGINVAGDGEMVPRQPLTGTAYANTAKKLDVNYTMPAADGTNGQVLKTNGTGTASWQNGFTVTQYTNTGNHVGDGSFNNQNPTVITATCATGTIIGGGCQVVSNSAGGTIYSYAGQNYPSSSTTWACSGLDITDNTITIKAYAICIE